MSEYHGFLRDHQSPFFTYSLLKILQYLKHNPLLLKKNQVWYKNYYFFIDNIE